MGKQIIIQVADLLEAGCTLYKHEHILPMDDQFPETTCKTLHVEFLNHPSLVL